MRLLPHINAVLVSIIFICTFLDGVRNRRRPCSPIEKELKLLELCRNPTRSYQQARSRFYAILSLLKQGVDPNMSRSRENNISFEGSPLGYAAFKGNCKWTELLLNYGAHPRLTYTIKDQHMQALHSAAFVRFEKKHHNGFYEQTMKALVARGADPNIGGNKQIKRTPLHILCMQKIPPERQLAIAQVLFNAGVLEQKERYDGKTAEQLAQERDLHDLAILLRQRTQKIDEASHRQHQFVRLFLSRDFKAAAEQILCSSA